MSNKSSGTTRLRTSGGGATGGGKESSLTGYAPAGAYNNSTINDALSAYKNEGDTAYELNEWLRGNGNGSGFVKDMHKKIERAFDEYPLQEGTFLRGLHLTDSQYKALTNLKIGDKYTMQGYGSATSSQGTANFWANNALQGNDTNKVILRIKGRGLAMENFRDGDLMSSEHEYLFRDNSDYRITKKSKKNGITYIDMTQTWT